MIPTSGITYVKWKKLKEDEDKEKEKQLKFQS